MGVCGADCFRTETCATEGRILFGVVLSDNSYFGEIK